MEKKILFPQIGGIMHGGDYNPEQWLDRPDIVGSYIGKIYLETKKRPRYIVEKYINERE